MITKETENKIYEIILSSGVLTRKDQINLGLNYSDINKLIETGIIERVKNGQYKLLSVDGFYKYGRSLLLSEKYDKAKLCFEKCLELDPNHQESRLELLLINIINHNYQKVLELLSNTDNPKFKRNHNLYLYLLNFIIDIPKEYREQILSFTEDDILLQEEDKQKQNKIINHIMNHEFLSAFKIINKLSSPKSKNYTEYYIIKELLSQTIMVESATKDKLLELAKNENYDELVSVLENKRAKVKLSHNEEYTLKILKAIIKILKTNELPTSLVTDPKSLEEAIDGNNFKLAHKINLEHLEIIRLDKTNDIIEILLCKIDELFSQFQLSENFTSNSEDNQNEIDTNEKIDFTDVLLSLLEGELDHSLDLLNKYLKLANKLEYEYLIVNLIKLSVLEADKTFYNPIAVLVAIDKNTYNFNISIYLQEFYFAISQNKLEHAKIYLDIIKKYGNSHENIIKDLENSLKTAEQNKIVSFQSVQQSEEKTKVAPIIPNQKEVQTPYKVPTLIPKSTDDSKSADEYDVEKERIYLLNRLSQMKEKNQVVVLLKKMPYERRRAIYKAAKTIPELIATGIGEEPQNIFLRYVKEDTERLGKKELIKKSYEALGCKDFPGCIKYSLRLLEDPTFNPYYSRNYASIFSILGLSYNIIGGKREALKYLTIATEINKNDPKGKPMYDYTGLINSLKYGIPEDEESRERKPLVVMKEHEFNEDLNITFGVKNIQEIAYYISSEGQSIAAAGKHFNLSEEDIQLVKLIYARDYFLEGMDEMGDKLLREIDKSKHKSKTVIKILNRIRSNKRFYKERINKHTRKKVLIYQTNNN